MRKREVGKSEMILRGQPSLDPQWAGLTLSGQLQVTAEKYGDRPAVFCEPNVNLSWSEVRERSRAIAKGLRALGVRSGDRVCVWLPNSPEWFLTWLASSYLGAVTVPVNTRLKTPELAYVLGDASPKILVMMSEFLHNDNVENLHQSGVLASDNKPLVVMLEPSEQLDSISMSEVLAKGHEVSDGELDRVASEVSIDDPTVIVYTSGSTGFPKGVVHTHMILRNECAVTCYLRIEKESIALGHMPFFHVAGGFSALLPALITGSSVVTMTHWDPDLALNLISKYRVTVFGGIATHYFDLLSRPQSAVAVASLRSGWIGGAFNPRDVMIRAKNALGYLPMPSYGMTETTSVTTFPDLDDSEEMILSGRGKPISDFEVRVVNPDSGDEMAPEVPGEICVRGHVVMHSYFGRPDATNEAIDQGRWFHTGDIGVIGEDGYLSVVGRVKDMYTVGGNNVYPIEIEKALADHPAINQAYVVPVPDERLGDTTFAFVERKENVDLTADGVINFCRDRLTSYKVPRHVRFIDEWPVVVSGKVDKLKLREIAKEDSANSFDSATTVDIVSSREARE